MNDSLAVSVVMSVYNGADTLAETIDSVLAQRDADFELVIVDDGSTDDTPRILERYTDPRIRVIRQQNRGLTQALIAGCAVARGRYIARQDAGDLSAPDRLAREARVLDGGVTFVSCWTSVTGPELEPMYVSHGNGKAREPVAILDLSQPHAVIDGPAHHGSVMFRRDAYERAGGYRPQFRFGQDWDLWYRLAAIGTFQMIEEVLYTARISPRAISMVARPSQRELAKISEELVRVRAAGGSEAELLDRAARIAPPKRTTRCDEARGLYFIGEALRRNGDRRARSYLRRAAMSCPMLLAAWIRLLQSARLP